MQGVPQRVAHEEAAPGALGAGNGEGGEELTDGRHGGRRVGVGPGPGVDGDDDRAIQGEGGVRGVSDDHQGSARAQERAAQLHRLHPVASHREAHEHVLGAHVGEHVDGVQTLAVDLEDVGESRRQVSRQQGRERGGLPHACDVTAAGGDDRGGSPQDRVIGAQTLERVRQRRQFLLHDAFAQLLRRGSAYARAVACALREKLAVVLDLVVLLDLVVFAHAASPPSSTTAIVRARGAQR